MSGWLIVGFAGYAGYVTSLIAGFHGWLDRMLCWQIAVWDCLLVGLGVYAGGACWSSLLACWACWLAGPPIWWGLLARLTCWMSGCICRIAADLDRLLGLLGLLGAL